MRNKIEIIENFLSNNLCEDLIDFIENNKSLTFNHTGNLIEIEITKMNRFNDLFNTINNYVYNLNCEIDWIHIVKWRDDCNQDLHLDTSENKTVYSSIMYLNDGYLGGQTFFEDGLVVKPIKGKALFFNGIHYKHGVLPVKKGPRYTLATWYKDIK